jgi:hypothetical protein
MVNVLSTRELEKIKKNFLSCEINWMKRDYEIFFL